MLTFNQRARLHKVRPQAPIHIEPRDVLHKNHLLPLLLPHLKRRVGAANFLYHVCLNNKMLIADTALVRIIIDGALEACIELDR